VETIAAVPHIINRGAAWFAGLGTKDPGRDPALLGVGPRGEAGGGRGAGVGDPALAHLRPLRGIPDGRRLKAVVPGGSSAPILTADEIDVSMDADGLKAAGTMIGSAGVIVMDENGVDPGGLMVVARFYAHESCGQCTPCREIHRLDLQDVAPDRGRQGRKETSTRSWTWPSAGPHHHLRLLRRARRPLRQLPSRSSARSSRP